MPKHVHEVVHTLRDKPLHVRENIAMGVAGGITFIVAVLWFVANAAGGTFALLPDQLPSNAPDVSQAVATSKDGFTQLLGAAGSAIGATSSPATITIIDTQSRSTLDQPEVPPDATVIHF